MPDAPFPPIGETGLNGEGPESLGGTRRASLTGLLVALASTTMVFAAFTSAFVVRRGLGDDWKSTPMPPVLFANTAALLLSSVALEAARRALRRGARPVFNAWWIAGTVLGLCFLAGQAAAWRYLAGMGILAATNPSSSFFYVLTAAHGVHLLGGVGALLYVGWHGVRYSLGPRKRTVADLAAIFWHFLDGLWIYLMVLFRYWG